MKAVAARDQVKAQLYAKKHGIPEVKASYQSLIDDPEIDCIYIPLPNGLHYEWTTRALKAGKHVLLEKPSVSNAAEAEALFNPYLASPSVASAPVLLEAVHPYFHPAWSVFMKLVAYEEVEYARGCIQAPWGMMGQDDIRFSYDLAGGALMDMGPYAIGVLRMIFGSPPETCEECIVNKISDTVDQSYKARFRFPNGGIGVAESNLRSPWTKLSPDLEVTIKPIVVDVKTAGLKSPVGEGQEIIRKRHVHFKNYAVPSFYHSIEIKDEFILRKAGDGSSAIKKWTSTRQVKAYTFEEAGMSQPGNAFDLTYRYMLEQFVNRVRGKETPQWVEPQYSIDVAKMIDMAYTKAGLPLRPSNTKIVV